MTWLMSILAALDGARKLLLCVLLAVLCGIPLLLLGKIDGAQWSGVASTAIASYCGANVAEYAIDFAHEWISKRFPKPPSA